MKVVSSCGFGFHFLDVEPLHVGIGHSYIFFGEMSTQVLCLFLN
jgi:hypothetical protein